MAHQWIEAAKKGLQFAPASEYRDGMIAGLRLALELMAQDARRAVHREVDDCDRAEVVEGTNAAGPTVQSDRQAPVTPWYSNPLREALIQAVQTHIGWPFEFGRFSQQGRRVVQGLVDKELLPVLAAEMDEWRAHVLGGNKS